VQYVYYSGKTNETGSGDYLKQYSITDGVVSAAPVELTKNLFLVGSTPSISADGTGNGIVWAVERKDPISTRPGTQPAVLYAYNATDVSDTLYSSANAAQLRDQPAARTSSSPPPSPGKKST